MESGRETLREQQKRLARERIIEAAAAAVATHGLTALSVPCVAEAAGVSLRTVYNYFETKEALVNGIEQTALERLERAGMIDVEPDLERVAEAVRHNWPQFGDLGEVGDAWSVIRIDRALSRGRSSTGTANPEQDSAMRDAVDAAHLDLEDAQRQALFVLLRSLVSSESFFRMKQLGVETREATEVTAWAFEILHGALGQGRRPFGETT